MLADLRDFAFNSFLDLARLHLQNPQDEGREIFPDWPSLQALSGGSKLYDIILDWSKRHNLNEDWVRDFAIRALRIWRCSKMSLEALEWCDEAEFSSDLLFEVDGLIDEAEFFNKLYGKKDWGFKFAHAGFSLSHRGWNPFVQRKQEWKQSVLAELDRQLKKIDRSKDERLRGAFNTSLASYLVKVERWCDRAKLKRSPSKTEGGHFEWLAWFQICERSSENIAQQYKTTRQTVEDGIKRTSSLIGLTLRAALKAGRPSKSRR